MKMTFPHRVTKQGVSVTIGRVEKGGQQFFRVLYRQQGKQKQVWRSTFEAAKQAASEAIEAMLTGDHSAWMSSLRACRSLSPLKRRACTPSQVSPNVPPGVRTLAFARGGRFLTFG